MSAERSLEKRVASLGAAVLAVGSLAACGGESAPKPPIKSSPTPIVSLEPSLRPSPEASPEAIQKLRWTEVANEKIGAYFGKGDIELTGLPTNIKPVFTATSNADPKNPQVEKEAYWIDSTHEQTANLTTGSFPSVRDKADLDCLAPRDLALAISRAQEEGKPFHLKGEVVLIGDPREQRGNIPPFYEFLIEGVKIDGA